MLSRRLYSALLMGIPFWAALGIRTTTAAQPNPETLSYGVKRLTTEDGLPQDTIRSLLQSRDGYLWIGTSAGVARYDGVKFTAYVNELLPSGAGDARVWDLLEDGEGRIWVRTEEALASFYLGRWERFSCRAPPLGDVIQACCASREGGLWLAMTDGVKRFQNGRITRAVGQKDGLCANLAGWLGEDQNGCLWLGFGSPDGTGFRWQRLDPRSGEVKELSDLLEQGAEAPSTLVMGKSDGFWTCSASQFGRLHQGQTSYYPAPSVLTSHRLNHVTEGDDGSLWFLADGVGEVLEFRDGNCFAVDLPKLPSRDLRCLLADREGLVWVGSGEAGLFQLRPKQITSLLTTNQIGDRIEVFSVAPGQEARTWFGTSEGLVRLQNGVFTWFKNGTRNSQGKFEQSVRSVLEDRSGRVWFGVKNEGLKRLQGERFVQESAAGIGFTNPCTVSSLVEDRMGNLWIGSERGLFRRTPAGEFSRVSKELGFEDENINGIQEGPDRTILVGTVSAGLYEIQGNQVRRFTTREGLANDWAQPLCVEADGSAWVGTPKGLNRVRNGQVVSVTMREGLFDNQLYSLTDDSLGSYWATCNRGVFRMAKSELNAAADGPNGVVNCVSFGERDGLASGECNGECQPNAARTPDGRLWFSTTRGCGTIDPRGSFSKQVAPPVVIEEVLVDDQVVFKEGALTSDPKHIQHSPRLRLPAGRGRVLEIRYTANSFLSPAKVRFEHRLQGHDESWRNARTRRTAFYTDLSPGQYTFEVKACTDQGVWSSKPAVFAFALAPHFWQTWTFFVLSGATLIGLVAAVQSYRLRWQHRLLKLDEQRSLDSERARIARDLHDDLGTALTGLALELDLSARDAKDGQPLASRLGQTAKRTRDLADRMREVVWTINPRCDTVLSLATFLEQQISQFLSSDGVRVRLDFPDDIPALPLGGETRHQLALSVREGLNNVVRHARASEVNISLELAEDCLVVKITDNGCGFVVADAAGYGLSNMRGRMRQVGGNFTCISEPGHGTTVRFSIPLPTKPSQPSSIPGT